MIFAHPQILWLLLVFPPGLAAFFWWSSRTRQHLLTQFIQARLLPGLTVGISTTRQKIRGGIFLLAVASVIVALARPQWGFDWEETKTRGLDIVVAIDTSKSMLAEDIAPNRLARAKLAALDLMQQARSDRLGLVAFAGSAFLQCPLTVDDAAFRQSVESLDVNTIPQGGTALAEAIETALTAFKEGDNYKTMVLITDGEDHDSGALEAAKKAADSGLQIFTVGIGSAEGELLRIKDGKGRTDYIRDEQGNVVKSHLNEGLLIDIAKATRGAYYRLSGAKTIDNLYQNSLASLPKTEGQAKLVRIYHEHFHWPLALAIILLAAETVFPERKREAKERGRPRPRVPETPKPAMAPAVASILYLLFSILALLAFPTNLHASTSGALREYKSGQYEQALKEYQRLLERKPDDPRLHFNAGAAAYRNRQFEEAAKQFNQAVAAPDLNLQSLAYYNEGNALFHLGEKIQDPKKRNETWQKSLQDYNNTLKLNPQDKDAKFNYDFVKKKLEELKQQQQQQQQDKSNQDQNQDQQQQQQQQNQQNQQSQSNQQQNAQSQQNQSEQNKSQDQQAQQQQAEEQKKQQQQAQQQKSEQDKQAQASQGQPKENADDKQGEEQQAAAAAGQMTPQQAQQLLDAQKGDEKMLMPKSTGKPVDHSRPFKDW